MKNYDSNNDLDFDLDGDGLTTREELMYGLRPNAPDTDGDRTPDGREVARGSHPGHHSDWENQQQLRQRYFVLACSVLGWTAEGLSYSTLMNDINGDAWRGKALDNAVLECAIAQGTEPTEAAYLLAQSPYLQFLKERGQLEPEQMVGYIENLVDYQERTTSLISERVPEPELIDWELERKTE